MLFFSLLIPGPPIAAEARVDPRLSSPAGTDTDFLAAFSQASTDWGNGIEAVIEEAYRNCFRTYIVAGKVITLHLPFAENNERSELAGRNLAVPWGGKGDPAGHLGPDRCADRDSPDFSPPTRMRFPTAGKNSSSST